ncbi:MAG: hypothetical protein HKM24_05290 [Gammaproteobacteria bacterium]|nr:hypothetical protein [Gammaproteobacteria bacterium]
MQHNPYKIFVSHCWEADDEYVRLFEYLGETTNFFYDNSCNPTVPAVVEPEALRAELRKQIEPAECVIILATHFVQNIPLIRAQIEMARELGKPIVAVEPFSAAAMPPELEGAADEKVPWYNKTITNAIKKLARGEDSPAYEVLDFP